MAAGVGVGNNHLIYRLVTFCYNFMQVLFLHITCWRW